MGVDRESISEAYHDVRDDNTPSVWAAIEYHDDGSLACKRSGNDYAEAIALCEEANRLYLFVRIETGDELSRRAKFALITWIGERVSPLKKAKMSTDKASVKEVVQNFAKELTTSEKPEIEYDFIKREVQKAGGANYGTGR
ncbi:coactosin-like protein [Sycon ciliatum]|uniref:coactosin-like protein n=1 Tax=Sycon ciliatum TaxID=27933 RepID=UPI0020AD3995|eukprot:scpid94810/ scgid23892/ Coactosin-like protein